MQIGTLYYGCIKLKVIFEVWEMEELESLPSVCLFLSWETLFSQRCISVLDQV